MGLGPRTERFWGILFLGDCPIHHGRRRSEGCSSSKIVDILITHRFVNTEQCSKYCGA